MTPEDGTRFEGAMIALAAVTGKQLDVIINRAYWEGLEDIPGETVYAALKSAMTCCDFFPSVAEIRRICDEVESFALKAQEPERLALVPGPIIETFRGAALPDEDMDPPEPKHWCRDCSDSGFERFTCTPFNRCGAFQLCNELAALQGTAYTDTHTFVRKCRCVAGKVQEDPTFNPIIRRRLERMRETINLGKYSKPRTRPYRARTPAAYRDFGQGN